MTSRSEPQPKHRRGGSPWLRLLAVAAAVAVAAVVAQASGVFAGSLRDQVLRFDALFASLGPWAPAAFVLIWIAVSVLLLPGLPVSVVGGLVFGAVWGTVWTTLGANLGAAAAFLIGRYAARDLVAGWVAQNSTLRRLDEGVRRQGWRMLMVTRLVPLFPFNLQNYAYGLTDVRFSTYLLVTLPCMLPGTIAYTFAAATAREVILGGGRPEALVRSLALLAVATVAFVLLSLLPGWIRRPVDGGAPGGDEVSAG